MSDSSSPVPREGGARKRGSRVVLGLAIAVAVVASGIAYAICVPPPKEPIESPR